MTTVTPDRLDLSYLSSIQCTANEQLIFDIAGNDHILEAVDFFTCDYAQRYLFEQNTGTGQKGLNLLQPSSV